MNTIKIRAFAVVLFFAMFSLSVHAAKTVSDTLSGPKAAYSFNGNGAASAGGTKAIISKGALVPGFDGRSGGAYAFDFGKHYSETIKNIILPVNITRDPKVTLCCWAKVSNSMQRMYVLGNGTNKRNRCIITDYEDDQFRWGLNCGGDGILWGPPVVDEWVFVAAIYDAKNQEARLVVNDKVFASRSTAGYGEEKLFVGALIGAVDEIKIFDRILSQSEIEALSGKPITEGADELAIADKYSYKEKAKQKEENKVQVGDVFIVDAKEMRVQKTAEPSGSTVAMLTSGDSIRVTEKLKDGWCRITYRDGKDGYVRRSAIVENAYPKGDNVTVFRIKRQIHNAMDLRRLNSWLIIGVLAVILIFVAIYFPRLDRMLLRLHRSRDEFSDGGSKSDNSSPGPFHFLYKIYPVQKFKRYPLYTGVILGATMFIGAFWDAQEMEWFFNEGLNILPIGYTRPIHWFLYISCIANLLLLLSWVVESFVIGGPFVGLLRIFFLVILNLMAWLVTFCLLLLVAVLIIGLFVLKAFGSAATTRRVYYYE